MRVLALYLRSRGVPAALAVSISGMVAVGWAGSGHADAQRVVAAAVLAVGLGAAVLSHGLGGHDGVLDRTAAIRWAPRRLLHVAGIAAVVSGVVLVAAISVGVGPVGATAVGDMGPVAGTSAVGVGSVLSTVDAGVVGRDGLGFAGLAAVAATLFGRQLAWVLPVAVAGAGAIIPALPGPVSIRVLTWAAQPADSTAAAVTAAILAVVGAGIYVVVGPRPTIRG